jgi:hypothetical protein
MGKGMNEIDFETFPFISLLGLYPWELKEAHKGFKYFKNRPNNTESLKYWGWVFREWIK